MEADRSNLRQELMQGAEQNAAIRQSVQERARRAMVTLSAEQQRQLKYLMRDGRRPA